MLGGTTTHISALTHVGYRAVAVGVASGHVAAAAAGVAAWYPVLLSRDQSVARELGGFTHTS